MESKNPVGEKFEARKEIINRLIPLIVQDAYDLTFGDNAGTDSKIVASSFLSNFIGFSANTYAVTGNWEQKNTKEMDKARKQLGEDQFNKMAKEYDKELDKKLEIFIDSKEWDSIDNEKRKEKIASIKSKLKKEVGNRYKVKFE